MRPDLKSLPLRVRMVARKLAKLTLERKAREAQAAAASVIYLSTHEGLTLGTGDQPPVIGTYTPPAPYRVFRVIRNPVSSGLTRGRRLTRAALRLVKG